MVVSGQNRDGLQIRRRSYGNFAGAKQRRSIRVKSSQLGRCAVPNEDGAREREREQDKGKKRGERNWERFEGSTKRRTRLQNGGGMFIN